MTGSGGPTLTDGHGQDVAAATCALPADATDGADWAERADAADGADWAERADATDAAVARSADRQSRRWFAAASAGFVEIVGSCPRDRLTDPALGEWTLRDLVGHASRAYLTLEDYLEAARPACAADPSDGRQDSHRTPEPTAGRRPPRLGSATAYLLAARSGLADPTAVRDRGRVAGEALGDNPGQAVARLAARAVALVARTSGDAEVLTPVGRMVLSDYLPTRAFELTVHGLDIARAVGRRPPAALRVALRPALHLCADLLSGDDRMTVLVALTGRAALPHRSSLV